MIDTKHIKFLTQRGYIVQSHSPGPDGKASSRFLNYHIGLGARATALGTELYFVTEQNVTVSTGAFQNSHPRFDMFERNMTEILAALHEKGIA